MSNDKKVVTKKTIKKKNSNKSTNSNEKLKIVCKNILNKLKIVFNKLKIIVLKFLRKHWDLILMNIIIFILTVFIESQYLYNLKLLIWFSNTILFIIIPTILFTYKRPIKSKDIVLSLPILYVLFLIFLDYCTIRELYGISSLGLDKTPNYVDAIMVVFIFTTFEYITAYIVNKIKDKKIKTDSKKVPTKKKIKK